MGCVVGVLGVGWPGLADRGAPGQLAVAGGEPRLCGGGVVVEASCDGGLVEGDGCVGERVDDGKGFVVW